MKAIFFAVLLLASTCFAQVCVSNSPNSGNTASVIPSFTAGDTLSVYTSAFATSKMQASITDSGSPQQTYTQASNYSTALTGSGVLFFIPGATSDLIGQAITATWTKVHGNMGVTITVCDLGAGLIETGMQGYSTRVDAKTLTSGLFDTTTSSIDEYCVGGGLTEVSGWTADTANGWFIPTGADTDHSACSFLVDASPFSGTTFLSWTQNILHAYSLIVGFTAGAPVPSK